jgi:hypothetical protein
MRNPKKLKPRTPKVALPVKSELKMPKEILPWELELLTTVLNAVNEGQNADSQRTGVPQ